ncbi:MAG: ribonucleoside-diphosphate reductase subunit alpha [Candidatus Moeniiplasma glomeromycotorum]|nr:ribonucleoside-diphosphate reductase subunit alpha [Candidatus Moeniiplasma glomeromycotorum]MCE8168472.1 ribonucleoside-diphosphate reductase subunit alpha [Candidatus Moeniiplasma glomeromycotorum]
MSAPLNKKEKIIGAINQILGTDPQKDINDFYQEVEKNIHSDLSTKEIFRVVCLTATSFLEKDPIYDKLAANFLLHQIYWEVFGETALNPTTYQQLFISNIKLLAEKGILDKRLLEFDLAKLSQLLVLERDELFNYLGLETLAGRYLLRRNNILFETPQFFWLRIAMGLAINEPNKNQKAQEFYNLISNLRFIPSTPTLFHAGLVKPQLSSCFLMTVEDDLSHIYKSLGDKANLLKHSGGVAADWTNLRALGSPVKSIDVEASGLISFLKVANSTTDAINRSGRRRGASAAYLEVWHLEIEDFLDLRRNVGDERRRTHELNLAAWIPDLFMLRVKEGKENLSKKNWTLFSPDETPDLHHLYGQKFGERYTHYEKIAQEGKMKLAKQINAFELWKKMLTRLFETGYPWITFKDSCNIRSPQDHAGVVHCSNLCTEITLNTSEQEIAVCNLGSVNLARHIQNGKLNDNLFQETIAIAIRMLDNVIDLNSELFSELCPEAQYSNSKHRPIGLGMMGFQDALFQLNINYNSPEALEFTDELTEKFSYYAISASSQLAEERGTYSSYQGSKWDRGIFPLDTLDLLEKERGQPIKNNRQSRLNWESLKERVKKYGMRNSNTMAIAPTATIANIAGCYPCIEAMYSNLYVKSNVTGEFTIVNKYLVADLKKINLWNQSILDQIKYYEGGIQKIPIIPQNLKEKYRGVFEIDPLWMVEIAAMRSKWIDQSISHNVFMKGVSGSKLNNIYFAAWEKGLKTTYYLRSLGASRIESSTLDAGKFGFTQKRDNQQECLLNSDCESCQ